MGCAASSTAKISPPESIAFFFNGEPMAGKAERYMGELVADSATLAFVGPHVHPALDGKTLPKPAFGAKIGDLVASFPDLTFNATKVAPTLNADGSWSADIVVTGTHTGAAYTPMPGVLPPIEATNKVVKIGPETFTLWADADGKMVKTEITPLGAGHPHGPPGFYLSIGGEIPAPAPPLPDMLMQAEVKDFSDWFAGFKAHATETTFPMNGTTYTVPLARGEACDEAKTLVFTDVKSPNSVAIMMYALDMAKFGPVMADPQFVAMSDAAIVNMPPPLMMSDPGPTAGAAPSMFFCVEVDDPDKWIAGFEAHGSSKTGTWGYEVPIARCEFCDESKTRVFRCASNPNLVAGYMEGVQMEKLGPLLGDESMARLTKDLGEKEGTKVMKVVSPVPAPPEDKM